MLPSPAQGADSIQHLERPVPSLPLDEANSNGDQEPPPPTYEEVIAAAQWRAQDFATGGGARFSPIFNVI